MSHILSFMGGESYLNLENAGLSVQFDREKTVLREKNSLFEKVRSIEHIYRMELITEIKKKVKAKCNEITADKLRTSVEDMVQTMQEQLEGQLEEIEDEIELLKNAIRDTFDLEVLVGRETGDQWEGACIVPRLKYNECRAEKIMQEYWEHIRDTKLSNCS